MRSAYPRFLLSCHFILGLIECHPQLVAVVTAQRRKARPSASSRTSMPHPSIIVNFGQLRYAAARGQRDTQAHTPSQQPLQQ